MAKGCQSTGVKSLVQRVLVTLPLGPPLRSDPQSYRALSDYWYLLTYSSVQYYSLSGGNCLAIVLRGGLPFSYSGKGNYQRRATK